MALDTSKTTWDFTPLFSGDNDTKMAEQRKIVEERSYEFINKWKNDKSYLTDPAQLKIALDEYEAWRHFHSTDGNEGYYFHLRSAQNENDNELKAKNAKIEDFSRKILTDIQFFELQLSKIPKEDRQNFLDYAELLPYKHFLEMIFAQSKYILGEEAEKVMVMKSTPAYSKWVEMVSGLLAKEQVELDLPAGKQKKNFAEIMSLLDDSDKAVRDESAGALNAIFVKHSDVAEAEINAILENKKVDDLLRGMPRPDLIRHLQDDMDSEVVDTLLQTVSSRFSISKRYYELKAKLFGREKLAYHERNVPYGSFDKKYSYQEAVDLVYGVLDKIDTEFGDISKKFVELGHVDAYPSPGKHSGAFCAYHLLSQPTYVLLNFNNRLRDVTTIAHEFGHGINNELMRKKQNALNFGTPMSTAEVASTFMEDFVLLELSKDLDEEGRLALMMQKLNDDISTIFRQIAGYQFEQQLHAQYREKGYLSKENIGSIFQKHMSAYMGEAVTQDIGSENWWIYWSHIRAFFYVYSYAGGLLISKSMQNSVRKDPAFIVQIKEFLSAGTSDSPKNLFLKLGIDIMKPEFWNKGMDEVEQLLNEAEALAKKLGKI